MNLNAPKPQILAPQANEWETKKQEVEVVRGSRFGLIMLFLLALLAVAVIALGLAARSVFGGGADLAEGTTTDGVLGADPSEGAASDGTSSDGTGDGSTGVTPDQTPASAVPDPDGLQVQLTENPFVCDGVARPFATLSGAAPSEQISFTSPQSSGILPGTAEADGTLSMRWICDPEQVGTTWDVTATGDTSGKSVTFSVVGVDEAGGTDTTLAPTKLTVTLIESPFLCDGESRIFGGLSGAEPNEQISFSSPQSSGLSPGTADAEGSLEIRWDCDPTQAGTVWELTATGVTSGRAVTFSFTGF